MRERQVDTRTKIVSFEEAVNIERSQQVRWVTGAFDPLLAEHAQQLREFAQPDRRLIVVVIDIEKPLLSQRARAELVAALSMVDHVVMKIGPPASRDPDEACIAQEFIGRVLSRSALS